MLNTVQ